MHVKVKRETADATIVKIRVGVFGDKDKSIVIMQAIDNRLGVK